jgi:hypothetical protein
MSLYLSGMMALTPSRAGHVDAHHPMHAASPVFLPFTDFIEHVFYFLRSLIQGV